MLGLEVLMGRCSSKLISVILDSCPIPRSENTPANTRLGCWQPQSEKVAKGVVCGI
jgi:hypothetical protein